MARKAEFSINGQNIMAELATRKEMLKKEIKVSDSKKQIEEIFAAEVLENVKKGWEKVGKNMV